MEIVNVFHAGTEPDETPDGFHSRELPLGERLGAARLGMTVYDLAPGEKTWPYHFELAEEEWAIVLAGEPTLREPGGEQRLRPGDVVCFPTGPEGAHQLRNDTGETVRVALLGEVAAGADGCVYPDTDKVKVAGAGWVRRVRAAPEVEYWEGEP